MDYVKKKKKKKKKGNRTLSRNVTSQKHKQFLCGNYLNPATYHTCSVHWKGGSCMQQYNKQSVIKNGRVLVG